LEAADGEEALRAAAAHAGPIHLLLTDVVMPGMNGRELAVRLSAGRPGLRLMFTSGYSGEDMRRRGVDADGHLVLPKPFHAAELLRAVRETLDAAPQ
jgi:CheY-like chemotaxis protein